MEHRKGHKSIITAPYFKQRHTIALCEEHIEISLAKKTIPQIPCIPAFHLKKFKKLKCL